jgi:hypothetical protein
LADWPNYQTVDLAPAHLSKTLAMAHAFPSTHLSKL